LISELRSRHPARTGNVLLLETDPATRELLARALGGLGYTVRAEADGAGVEQAARALRPDVALIDLRPGDRVDGITVGRWLRAHDDVPVLFLGATRNAEDIVRAFQAGADDYLARPFVVSELVARMESVLRHTRRPAGDTLSVDDLTVDLRAHSCTRAGEELNLTPREFAVLAMLCRHAGRILSKSQLMAEVWPTGQQYDDNVVEVHVSALRRKLEAHGPRLVHTVRGAGYVLRS